MASTLAETGRIGKRGTLVIPARLRERFHLEEGSMLVAEETSEGILLRPARLPPVEMYTPERVAEFLLSNAVGEAEYADARREVEGMGLDPDSIEHIRPE